MAVSEKVGPRWVLRARVAGGNKGTTTASQEKTVPALLRGTKLPQPKAREKLSDEALGG